MYEMHIFQEYLKKPMSSALAIMCTLGYIALQCSSDVLLGRDCCDFAEQEEIRRNLCHIRQV